MTQLKIKIINPDRSKSMTSRMLAAAVEVAAPSTTILCEHPQSGPRVINDAFTSALASPKIIEVIDDTPKSELVDAFVIACFGDPAVHAAREITSEPVIGIGEASILMARNISRKVSILGVGPWSRWVYEDVISATGAHSMVASIRTPEINSQDLVDNAFAATGLLLDECKRAVTEDRAEAIILGCGGMVGMSQRLQSLLGVPVIDPVQAGVKLAEALVGMQLKTSKTGSYRTPLDYLRTHDK